jgi:hypothetical protein
MMTVMVLTCELLNIDQRVGRPHLAGGDDVLIRSRPPMIRGLGDAGHRRSCPPLSPAPRSPETGQETRHQALRHQDAGGSEHGLTTSPSRSANCCTIPSVGHDQGLPEIDLRLTERRLALAFGRELKLIPTRWPACSPGPHRGRPAAHDLTLTRRPRAAIEPGLRRCT